MRKSKNRSISEVSVEDIRKHYIDTVINRKTINTTIESQLQKGASVDNMEHITQVMIDKPFITTA